MQHRPVPLEPKCRQHAALVVGRLVEQCQRLVRMTGQHHLVERISRAVLGGDETLTSGRRVGPFDPRRAGSHDPSRNTPLSGAERIRDFRR